MAMRFIDADCSNASCGFQMRDQFFAAVPDVIQCPHCGFPMTQLYLPRTRHETEWRESDAVVVFKDAQGRIRYPMRNDAPTPSGYERVSLRSLRAVDKFEREHKVVCEGMHYDRSSGTPRLDDRFRGEDYR